MASGMASPVPSNRPASSASNLAADGAAPAAASSGAAGGIATRRQVTTPSLGRANTAGVKSDSPAPAAHPQMTPLGTSSTPASAAAALGSPSALAAGLAAPSGHRFRGGVQAAAAVAAADVKEPLSGHAEATGRMAEEVEDLSVYEDDAAVKREKWDGALPPLVDPFHPEYDPAVLTGIRSPPPIALLTTAAAAGDWKLIVRIMSYVPATHLVEFVNAFDDNGFTAVFHCLERDKPEQLEALNVLICYGANVNVQSRAPKGQPPASAMGNTPMHVACGRLNKKAVRALMYRGARTDIENAEYASATHVIENEEQRAAMVAYVQQCAEEYEEMVDSKQVVKDTPEQRATFRYVFDSIDREHKGFITVRDITTLLVTIDPENEHEYKLPDPNSEIKPYMEWFESHNRDGVAKVDFNTFLAANIAHLNSKAKWLKRLAKKKARLARRRASPKADPKK